MKLSFKYEKYKDVRSNLSGYTALLLLLVSVVWYFVILIPSHQSNVNKIYSLVQANDVVTYGLKSFTMAGICALIAYLFIEVIKIHDDFYDRYITRWRKHYAVDYIIPVLVSPLANHLLPRFYLDSVTHTGKYQEDLYYPFVGDGNQTFNRHKVIRFYECVTPYWMTIVNELVLIANLVFVIAYSLFFDLSPNQIVKLFYVVITLIGLFALNRIFIGRTLNSVKAATREEIFEIHSNHLPELTNRLNALCTSLNLGWNP